MSKTSEIIQGVYIFKADSGVTLYSRRTLGIEEDLFSAFLSALKGFFSSFSLGGLSTFASDTFIVYLASANNVLTSLIVGNDQKSDKFFNLAFEIGRQYYKKFAHNIDSRISIMVPPKEQFDPLLDQILSDFDKVSVEQQEIIRLYKLNPSGELDLFEFIDEKQLYGQTLFIAVNFVTKHIFIIENIDSNISSRQLFFANKAVSTMNQRDLKSEFVIRQVSDPWDLERVITQISKLLKRESINV